MAIDSAYKTIQHEVGQDALHDVVEQCKFGRLPSRPVGTEKDVKYEERPVGCNPKKTPLVRDYHEQQVQFRHVAG